MCGIAGFYLKDPSFIDHEQQEKLLDALLLGIEHRGTDASGYMAATVEGKKVKLEKDDIPASYFYQTRQPLAENIRMVIAHTRLATQGKPDKMENNHPVQFESCFVTHNGCIYNDDSIIKECGAERVAEVDSIAVPTLVSQHGFDKALEVLPQLQGSWALAIADPIKNPDELLLVRGSSSPLVLIDHPKIVVWASVMKCITDAWEFAIGTPPETKKFDWLSEGEAMKIDADGTTNVSTFMEKPSYQATRSFRTTSWTGWNQEDEDEFVSGPARVRNYQPDQNKPMCFECGEKFAYFTVVDSYTDGGDYVEWDVPVCFDCEKSVKDNGIRSLSYRHGGDAQVKLRHIRSWQTCELCQKESAIGFNKIGAKLCERCLDTEPKLIASFKGDDPMGDLFLTLNPGDVIPMKMRKAFTSGCESCGSNVVAYIGDDGLPICGVCRMAEEHISDQSEAVERMGACEGCKVFFKVRELRLTMLGKLCNDCIASHTEEDEKDTRVNFRGYLREAEELHDSADASSTELTVAAAMKLHVPFVMWLARTCSQDHLEDMVLTSVYDEVVGRIAEADLELR